MKRLAFAVVTFAMTVFSPVVWSQGSLENPQQNGFESGIGVVSGWHCTSRNIEIRVDGVSQGLAGAGTSRGDTMGVCGRTDTGFSLLLNYNLLKQGTHRIEALVNGSVFGTATFNVGTLGGEFLTGLSEPISVGDFPSRGTTTLMRWAQSKQNFVIEGSASTNAYSLNGRYVLNQFFVVLANGNIVSSSRPGVTFAGTMQVRSDGGTTQTVQITIDGVTSSGSASGVLTDNGFYIRTTSPTQTANTAILSRGNVLTTQFYSTEYSEVDVWTWVGPSTADADSSSPPAELSDGNIGGLFGSLNWGLSGY